MWISFFFSWQLETSGGVVHSYDLSNQQKINMQNGPKFQKIAQKAKKKMSDQAQKLRKLCSCIEKCSVKITIKSNGRIDKIPKNMKNIQKIVNVSLGFYPNAPDFFSQMKRPSIYVYIL